MARLRTLKLRIMAALAATLLLLAACNGDVDDTQTTGPDGGEATGGAGESVTLQVSAVDNSFDPSSLSAPAASEVTVEVTNNGSNPHTFTIDDVEVDTSTIAAGESATATFTMPETSIAFYCAIHGESAMSGAIDVS